VNFPVIRPAVGVNKLKNKDLKPRKPIKPNLHLVIHDFLQQD